MMLPDIIKGLPVPFLQENMSLPSTPFPLPNGHVCLTSLFPFPLSLCLSTCLASSAEAAESNIPRLGQIPKWPPPPLPL